MSRYVDAGDVNLDIEVVRRQDGTRITEADAEAQAHEVSERARQGRPSLSGDATGAPHIALRVSEELHQRLSRRAEAEGKQVSEIVREAIEHYL